MPDKPISPLRQRMIEDMTARRFKEKVQKDSVRHVRTFAAFLGRSPDTATSEDLRRFQLHLARLQIGAASINAAIAALRFFFTVTLERPDLVRPLRIVNEPRKAPVVLSQEEVARLLEAAPGVKYKAALSVAYGAGLRVSEGYFIWVERSWLNGLEALRQPSEDLSETIIRLVAMEAGGRPRRQAAELFGAKTRPVSRGG
jgi:integrase/recombinase XerD